MLYLRFSIALICVLFLFSCDEGVFENKPIHLRPKLVKISPDKVYPFDVVTIYGEDLGLATDTSFIAIDSVVIISASECLKWNNSFVQFIAPKNLKAGKISLIIGNTRSNELEFNYFNYPNIETIWVKGGTFLMGSKTGLGYEQPVHEVTLTKSFYISKYEITQKQWKTVMDYNPSGFLGDNLPVMNIKWIDAIHFCNRLSKLMNLDTCYIFLDSNIVFFDTSANGFRLPTEAEWEYACRAGSISDFAGNGNPLDMGWFDVNSGMKPHPVGEKMPNAWGIYDMHGNVWEWCWDWFDPLYYEISPKVDPLGPEKGKIRVVRGGSWQKGITFGRSSSRQFPEDQQTNFGFRVVRNAK